ncbi:MAG: DUF2461 family protein [Acidimicrobiales bacterium]
MFHDVNTWRETVDSERFGPELQATIDALVTETGAMVAGQELKTVPKPFAADHPRRELLKHKMIQVRWIRPVPTCISTSEFVDCCVDELGRAADLHRLFVSLPA